MIKTKKLLFLFIVSIFFLTGCYSSKVMTNLHPGVDGVKIGEDAFFQGDYTKASQIFKTIATKEKHPDIKNLAMYNLTVTRLMTSKNSTDLAKVMVQLEKWFGPKSELPHLNNPKLLVQAMKKIISIKTKEMATQIKKEKEGRSTIEAQNKSIKNLQKTIKTLEKQILAIENIDQEIQKKRTTN